MRLSNERTMPIFADHRSMCKFETTVDSGYVVLRAELKVLSENAAKEREKELRDEKHMEKCM